MTHPDGFRILGSDGSVTQVPVDRRVFWWRVNVLDDHDGGLLAHYPWEVPPPWPSPVVVRLTAGATEPVPLEMPSGAALSVDWITGVIDLDGGPALLVRANHGPDGAAAFSTALVPLEDPTPRIIPGTGGFPGTDRWVEAMAGGAGRLLFVHREPDGTWLSFHHLDGTEIPVWGNPFPDSAPCAAADCFGDYGDPEVYSSADGSLLAYRHRPSQRFIVWSLDENREVGDIGWPAWTLFDGFRHIAAIEYSGSRRSIRVFEITDGGVQDVTWPTLGTIDDTIEDSNPVDLVAGSIDLGDGATLASPMLQTPCSAAGMLPETPTDLPEAVAATHRRLAALIAGCDLDGLAELTTGDRTPIDGIWESGEGAEWGSQIAEDPGEVVRILFWNETHPDLFAAVEGALAGPPQTDPDGTHVWSGPYGARQPETVVVSVAADGTLTCLGRAYACELLWHLDTDGVGPIRFGDSGEYAIASMTASLGPPTTDGAWDETCGGRNVGWANGLTIATRDGVFEGYAYSGTDLRTRPRIGIGSTWTEVLDAYPDAEFMDEPGWLVASPFRFLFDPPDPDQVERAGTVVQIFVGDFCVPY